MKPLLSCDAYNARCLRSESPPLAVHPGRAACSAGVQVCSMPRPATDSQWIDLAQKLWGAVAADAEKP